jgi:hypothetical protein
MPGSTTLLFVYKTNSSVLGSLKDFSAHTKSASGSDACTLSAITHSPVGMKKEWKRFLKDLEIPSRSLDRNELSSEFGRLQLTFPVVLLQKGTELSVLIATEELNRCRDLNDLILLVKQRILDI